ncbi:hypothetical protein N9L68_01655 [bacterium]|nr:hypothetical protein [bacterium]
MRRLWSRSLSSEKTTKPAALKAWPTGPAPLNNSSSICVVVSWEHHFSQERNARIHEEVVGRQPAPPSYHIREYSGN